MGPGVAFVFGDLPGEKGICSLVGTGLASAGVAFVLGDLPGGCVICSSVGTGLVEPGVAFVLGEPRWREGDF